jgi:hypothetical protein
VRRVRRNVNLNVHYMQKVSEQRQQTTITVISDNGSEPSHHE